MKNIFSALCALFAFCCLSMSAFAEGGMGFSNPGAFSVDFSKPGFDFTGGGNSSLDSRKYHCRLTHEAQKVNKLAFDLYKSVQAEGEGENLVFSPYYLYRILGDLQFCSEGDLSEQIGKVLQNSGADNREFLKSLENKDYLKSASSLWANSSRELNKKFLKDASEKIGLEVLCENWKNEEPLREKIFAWVNSRSDILGDDCDILVNAMLQNLNLSDESAAVLMSISGFDADWKVPFDKEETKLGTFHYGENLSEKGEVYFMQREGADISLTSGEHFDFALIPYKGKSYSMVFAKPKGNVNLSELTQEEFEKSLLELGEQQAKGKSNSKIYLPKFDIKISINYASFLKNLGIDIYSFNESKIYLGKDKNLKIEQFLDFTHIVVDELSTKVRNMEVVVMYFCTPEVLRLDEPFMFFIVENKSGAIIYMGRFCKPQTMKKKNVEPFFERLF